MKTILVTGFEPFGEIVQSPSQALVEEIERRAAILEGVSLITDILPVIYEKAVPRIQTLIQEANPDIVLSFGVAAQREAVNLERVALNLKDTPQPDNAGYQPDGELIDQSAPLAYFSNLPLAAIRNHLQKRDIQTVISNHTGAYLCNAVFFAAAHQVQTSGGEVGYGFVHIPLVPVKTEDHKALTIPTLAEAVIEIMQRLADSGF
ncbi:MAG: pyroglutamyl-peptidase I [Anaerolineales bacterium]|nr:pyroglutamyl-peptidase I [Anaerolineales bacterium]